MGRPPVSRHMSLGCVSGFSTRAKPSIETSCWHESAAAGQTRCRRCRRCGHFQPPPRHQQRHQQRPCPRQPIASAASLLLLSLLILFASAPIRGATSGPTTATGNEKAIRGATDQDGERVRRQVASEATDCGECDRERQTGEAELDYDITAGGGGGGGGGEDDENQNESSELTPEYNLYITAMRLVEGEHEDSDPVDGTYFELPERENKSLADREQAPAGKLFPNWRDSSDSSGLRRTSSVTTTTNTSITQRPASSTYNHGRGDMDDRREPNNDQAAATGTGNNETSFGGLPRELQRLKSGLASRLGPASKKVAGKQHNNVGQCLAQVVEDSQNKMLVWTCSGLKRVDRNVTAGLEPKPGKLRLTWADFETLPADVLQPYRETLRDLLKTIERNAFANLTKLRLIYIFQAPRLVSFDFVVTGRLPDLFHIRIQQTGLRTWPDLSEFQQERLLTIELDNNRIESLGSRPLNIRAEVVNLEFNQINSIGEQTFNGSEIGTLSLNGNRQLSSIHPNAFANLKSLSKLFLSSTSLTQLPSAGLQTLHVLKLEDNYALKQIPSVFVLPALAEAHMTYSFHCCSFRYPKTHNPSAYEEHLRIQSQINAVCAKHPETSGAELPAGVVVSQTGSAMNSLASVGLRPTATSTSRRSLDIPSNGLAPAPTTTTTTTTMTMTMTTTSLQRAGSKPNDIDHDEDDDEDDEDDDTRNGIWSLDPHPPGVSSSPARTASSTARPAATAAAPSNSSNQIDVLTIWPPNPNVAIAMVVQNITCGQMIEDYKNIMCTPEPDAFNPCEDIMGYPVLRVAVWLVVACSMFGNLSVIVVLLGIYRRLSVPKFLQLNLAIGDLFMGVYLAMLAGADIATVGTYFNYALDWQHGLGCRLAGASSLFASQLSIFTLIVITFERYYTITYSIDLNMRLQLGWASRIMLIGWLYAFVSAMLPIFANINSYSKTSICLPMRTIYKSDRLFLLVLLIIDSCAFLIIFICYLRMYLLIVRQKTEASLKERTVAMRMALLVFTDFACWAPIIFFSSTALFGKPLISVTNSKILIVFFYPLNSMANPFLYVLSTRQYRRDLNYVISRWRHWRKNLFKSNDKRDFSNNNYLSPYGPANCGGLQDKYANLVAMNNLNAVAAMTGAASHLHGYRIPMVGGMNNGELARAGQQVELVRVVHSDEQRLGGASASHHDESERGQHKCHVEHSHRHKHKHNKCPNHHHHHCKQATGDTKAQTDKKHALERPVAAQYIIRHQILPTTSLTRNTTRTSRMISYEEHKGNNGRYQQQTTSLRAVKLGLVVVEDKRDSAGSGRADASPRQTIPSMRVANENIETSETNGDHLELEAAKVAEVKDRAGGFRQKSERRRFCSCRRQARSETDLGQGMKPRPVNWSTRLNMRCSAGGTRLRESTSKSATQSTMITEINSATNSSTNFGGGGGGGGGGGFKSPNDPDPDTTATLDTTTSTNTATTTTTSTTATSGNSFDLVGGSPESANDTQGKFHHGHHSRHHHHHHHHRHRHHHHHHRHRDSHSRSRSRCSGDSREVDATTKLERITESSNMERSSTPRPDVGNHQDNHNGDHRHHQHANHHRRHHRHRCRSRGNPTKEDENEEGGRVRARNSGERSGNSFDKSQDQMRVKSAQGPGEDCRGESKKLMNRRGSSSDSNLQLVCELARQIDAI